jgi:hypothetical protein
VIGNKGSVRELNLTPFELVKSVILIGFLGNSVVVNQAVECVVTIAEIELTILMYVIDEILYKIACLIGRNFTENPAISYFRINDELIFQVAKSSSENEVVQNDPIRADADVTRLVLKLGDLQGVTMTITLSKDKPIAKNFREFCHTNGSATI